MNYFELFDLPESLVVDRQLLSQRYIRLQRQYHPDFFGQATDAERAGALEMSALINRALKTLQNTDSTIAYVLQEKGLLEEEERYVLPPDFLMEMMELNEALEEDGTAPAELEAQINELGAALDSTALPLLSNWEPTGIAGLEAVKTYYFKKKYLNRIKERIRNIAPR